MARSILAALLFFLQPDKSAVAGVTDWRNSSLGDWFIGGNWSNGVPDQNTTAFIANGGTALITTAPTIVAATASLYIGVDGGSGTLQLSKSGAGAPGVLRLFNDLYVGVGNPGTGTLNISNGAKLTRGNLSLFSLAVISLDPQSHGTLSVTDPGSELNAINFLVGNAGPASLTISNGGKVFSVFSIVGRLAGSSGTVTVTGNGSSWENATGLFVGGEDNTSGGAAYLGIVSGGLVRTRSLKLFNTGLINVNNGSSAVAGLIISGSTSPPATGGMLGDMVIGEATGGRMEISGGGLSLNRRGFIGQNSGAVGAVTVSGAGSRWDCTGSVWSGNGGAGSLEITTGGVVNSAGNGYLGFSINSSGVAMVNGTGSSWTMAANLYVGGNGAAPGGQGVLRIENGGVVGATATTVYNTGILQLGANPTLNGPLTFLGGTIQAAANTNFNQSFSLGTGGVFVEPTGFELTLSGNISGSGGLAKSFLNGTGTLKLTGNNTYSGATTIKGGTLLVNGSITSATSVNIGGTLGGSGTVGTVTVNSGGTVAPGNPAVRLTVNGSYTQTSGGALVIELGGYTPGSGYDQLAVSGLATIGGTLNVSLINKFRPNVGDTFAIITSSSETGNFSTINNGCGFTVRSDASPNGIVLTITTIDPLPIVSNNNDGGPGSLRYVIGNACPGSTITFAANVRGTITLTGGELLITRNLTINGPGANLLSVQRGAAAGNFRIFNISPNSVIATISGLTIANGNVPGGSGGGISNIGTLTLASVTISGNTASGGAGGGIFNNFGTLTISHSTLSGNSVSSGIFSGSGGGIFNSGGTVTITHSTLSGNSAIGPGGNSDSGGGIITNVGTVTLNNSTISGNSGDFGGGIRNINGGTVRAKSTIIALNASASGPDVNGPLTSEGFNLIGNASGAVISPAPFPDRIGVTPAELNLDSLRDNGGPTQTRALLFGSAAIDQGNSSGSFTDQRGFSRPVDLPGGNVSGGDGGDIGAFEFGGHILQPEVRISLPQGNSVSLVLLGAPNTFYSLQFTSDLNDVWHGIGEVMTDAFGIGEFQHTQFVDPPPDLSRGFYRLDN